LGAGTTPQQGTEETQMTQHVKRAIRSISRTTERNIPVIERKMATGQKPDPAIVYAAAKYQEALERLAKE
jgi:hypothetical protein